MIKNVWNQFLIIKLSHLSNKKKDSKPPSYMKPFLDTPRTVSLYILTIYMRFILDKDINIKI